MTRFILVRHGQAAHNVSETYSHDTGGSKLTDLGKEQARRTGEYLKKFGLKPSLLVTSTMIRTIETGAIIRDAVGFKCTEENLKLFDEFAHDVSHQDAMEGMKMIEEFGEKYKNDPIAYFSKHADLEDEMDKKYKVSKQYTRKERTKTTAKQIAFMKKINGEVILLVLHSGVISHLVADILKIPHTYNSEYLGQGKKPGGNCSITIFDYDRKKDEFTCIVPTSTSHLD